MTFDEDKLIEMLNKGTCDTSKVKLYYYGTEKEVEIFEQDIKEYIAKKRRNESVE